MTENKSWIGWMARRYLKTKRTDKKDVISILAILGLGFGVATLICFMSVMNGFQGGTIRLLLELESYHLRIEGAAAKQVLGDDELLLQLHERLPGVESFIPFADTQGLVQGAFRTPDAAQLRAIPSGELNRLLSIIPDMKITAGETAAFAGDGVFVGESLAGSQGFSAGDLIDISILGHENDEGIRQFKVKVAGIVRFGNYGFDRSWILVPNEGELGRQLMKSPIIGVRLSKLEEDEMSATLIASLISARGTAVDRASIQSWREYNRSMFGALRVEKLMMTVVIGLMFVVVGVNIFQYLRASVQEKREDIAVLRALGAPPGKIRALFLYQGLFMGGAGALSGFVLGVLLVFNIAGIFGLIGQLSGSVGQLWFLMQLPTALDWTEAILIALSALVSAGLAAWAASRSVSGMNPAEILRQE